MTTKTTSSPLSFFPPSFLLWLIAIFPCTEDGEFDKVNELLSNISEDANSDLSVLPCANLAIFPPPLWIFRCVSEETLALRKHGVTASPPPPDKSLVCINFQHTPSAAVKGETEKVEDTTVVSCSPSFSSVALGKKLRHAQTKWDAKILLRVAFHQH